MTRSQDPGMTPQALTSAGSGGSAPRSPDSSANRQAATLAIGVAVVVHMLRSVVFMSERPSLSCWRLWQGWLGWTTSPGPRPVRA